MSATAEPSAILRTRHLAKRYGHIAAVSDLNLTVRRGEIYGFLGPNGAGKTSTILMLLGIEPATAGEIELFGQSGRRHPFTTRRRIGVVGEHPSLYDDLSAWEYLMFFARLYGVARPERRGRDLLERLDLIEFRRLRARDHSRGMQQKLALARALLHEPELLILDEPVSGLDPHGVLQVRELLLEENRRGVTLLLSSHLLSEVERTAHRVGILHGGRLVAEDDVGRLGGRLWPDTVIELTLERTTPALIESLEERDYVTGVEVASPDGSGQTTLRIRVTSDVDRRHEISAIVAAHGRLITEMRQERARLEEVFVRLTGERVEPFVQAATDPEVPGNGQAGPGGHAKTGRRGSEKREGEGGTQDLDGRASPRLRWASGAWRMRRQAMGAIRDRDLRGLLVGPGIYAALGLGMVAVLVVVRAHLDVIERNHVLILSDAFTLPFFIAATVAMLFLALVSAATVARERAQGALEVLFYGPVDPWAYVLAKYAAHLGGYVIMTLGIAALILAYAGLSGLRLAPEFALELVLSIFTAASVAAFGLLLSTLTRGVRAAYALLVAVSALLLAIHVGSALLSGIRVTNIITPLHYVRDLAIALDATLMHVSPVAAFQSGVDALVRGERLAYLRVLLLSAAECVVLVAAAVYALKWKGVRR